MTVDVDALWFGKSDRPWPWCHKSHALPDCSHNCFFWPKEPNCKFFCKFFTFLVYRLPDSARDAAHQHSGSGPQEAMWSNPTHELSKRWPIYSGALRQMTSKMTLKMTSKWQSKWLKITQWFKWHYCGWLKAWTVQELCNPSSSTCDACKAACGNHYNWKSLLHLS